MATTVYSVTVTKNNGGNYPELIDNTVCLLLSEAQNGEQTPKSGNKTA